MVIDALRVTTAPESAARDQAAIASGIDAFGLMLQAGTRAAEVILRDFSDRLANGVLLYAGAGNNGGDAYVVAAQLQRAGVNTQVVAVAAPRTPDARRAAALAAQRGVTIRAVADNDRDVDRDRAIDNDRHINDRNVDTARLPGVCVDGMLGTGHQGALRADVARATAAIAERRAQGAIVVALDLPSGLNATTGERAAGGVVADVTVTFGTIKRGVLIDRAAAGRIVVVDIGLGVFAVGDDHAWRWAGASTLSAMVPADAWNAHKGRRGHLAVVGGTGGMVGAIVLATRAALASGIGLVKAWVDAPGVPAMQRSVPQVITHAWDFTSSNGTARESDAHTEPHSSNASGALWGTGLAIGPGLGRSDASRAVLRGALARHVALPTVLDADALTLMAGENEVTDCGASRPMVLTPHPGEFARLSGQPTPDDWERRAEALCALANRTGATVLLKGTPTLVADPGCAAPVVVPRGTAVLATGGSGDMLTGIIGTLLAQGLTPLNAAVLGATIHGMAAEIATMNVQSLRGVTLDDVLAHMPDAWRTVTQPPALPPGVIAELPTAQGTL